MSGEVWEGALSWCNWHELCCYKPRLFLQIDPCKRYKFSFSRTISYKFALIYKEWRIVQLYPCCKSNRNEIAIHEGNKYSKLTFLKDYQRLVNRMNYIDHTHIKSKTVLSFWYYLHCLECFLRSSINVSIISTYTYTSSNLYSSGIAKVSSNSLCFYKCQNGLNRYQLWNCFLTAISPFYFIFEYQHILWYYACYIQVYILLLSW